MYVEDKKEKTEISKTLSKIKSEFALKDIKF
jgi:hypothetical protein